jgi:hypothetical protein
MRCFHKVEVLMPPKPWVPPEWTKKSKPTYEERIKLIDVILVPLPKIEVRP